MLLRCYWFTILVQYVFKQIKRKRLRWSFSWLFLMKDKCYSDYCGRNLTVFTYCFPWIAYQWGNRLFLFYTSGNSFPDVRTLHFQWNSLKKKNFWCIISGLFVCWCTHTRNLSQHVEHSRSNGTPPTCWFPWWPSVYFAYPWVNVFYGSCPKSTGRLCL